MQLYRLAVRYDPFWVVRRQRVNRCITTHGMNVKKNTALLKTEFVSGKKKITAGNTHS